MSRATAVKLPLPYKIQRSLLKGAGRIPAPLRAAMARLTTVNADGDRLDPSLALVATASAYIPSLALVGKTVESSRKGIELNSAMMAQTFPPFAIEEDLVIDTEAGPVPATRYSVDGSGRGLIVFYHGGGFVLGSRASHDSAARALAVASGADVLSVEYRMAPEHQFPAAVDDSVAAYRFAVENAPTWGLDPRKTVVAGDSAGGNLSAVVAQQVRGEDVTPCLQLLIYPVVDMSRKRESMHEFSTGYFLTEEQIDYFCDTYLPSRDILPDPRVSPLLADDLTGLAPAHVVVAGFDPLRDEGLEYADALDKAGVPVTVERASGMIHGFINMALLSPTAQAAVTRMGEAVAKAIDAVG
ncbi:alpha/beta hydrolase [Gordonia phthalatica]|uniref:Alpha/beta hydrolase n=1 Tax=Gordonia phthalatica TaxID=1136941 RepID=A0A0N7FV93_9ACTN|nr:alpha/beta hydrolase [Gordonia phthalatica]ALG86519.1 alpha/beta hydrolase [Gordonia phthalatica]